MYFGDSLARLSRDTVKRYWVDDRKPNINEDLTKLVIKKK